MDDSRAILKKYWGFDTFRSPQDLIIQSVLDKKDTIALLPTGGGKSICFQVPSLINTGKTIVVSPLIALMQDQVEHLHSKGIRAKSLHSNLSFREIDAILDDFVYGDLKLLYISPERIQSEVFALRIAKSKVDLIAVDEAHCISQWGYDFRPSYFNIHLLREIHPNTPIIALTATATPKVLTDIAERLELKKPVIFTKSFARDNLSLTVILTDDKMNEILQIMDKVKGCAIIYVRNRKETIEMAQWLHQHGIGCVSYHGGMERTVREKNQQAWMANRVRVMVSTNAFGMGIDKPDVRLVLHLDVAPSIEEYYQEAGRAGRDGVDAYGVAVISESDMEAATTNFNDQFPSIEIISSVYDRLCRYLKVAYGSGMMETYPFYLIDFAEYLNISVKKVYHIINILEKEGWVTLSDAFKEPSKVMILANTEDINYIDRVGDIRHTVLIHLLRKYEGLFIDPVKIDENKIAHELRLDEPQLVHTLHLLRAEGIISYVPRSSEPLITFTQPRPGENSFTIDRKTYHMRKKMASERLEAMVRYIRQDTDCRQSYIVDYFGETGAQCGKCDICNGSSATILTTTQLVQVYDHLIKTIQQRPIQIKKYIALYPFNKRKRILKAIQDFESERKISMDNAGLIHVVTS